MASKSSSRKIAGSLRGIFSSRKHTSSTVETWSSSNPFRDPAPVPDELPPPYTPTYAGAVPTTEQQSPIETLPPWRPSSRPPSVASSSASGDIPSVALEADDRYDFLAYFDTIFLIDDSTSMTWDGSTPGTTRWAEVKKVLEEVVPICTEYDKDGVDVYFLNSRNSFKEVKNPAFVDEIFEEVYPYGGTPTANRIREVLEPRIKEFEVAVKRRGARPKSTGVKPVNLIVITDGAPDPDPPLANVLVSIAQRLDAVKAPPHQFGIQFFQVGKDRKAARALKHLDDNLKPVYGSFLTPGRPIRDMIDTVTFDDREDNMAALSSKAILKVVLGAVSRKVDNREVADMKRSSADY